MGNLGINIVACRRHVDFKSSLSDKSASSHVTECELKQSTKYPLDGAASTLWGGLTNVRSGSRITLGRLMASWLDPGRCCGHLGGILFDLGGILGRFGLVLGPSVGSTTWFSCREMHTLALQVLLAISGLYLGLLG